MDNWKWRWVHNRWPQVAYRTKLVIERVMEAKNSPWHPFGAGNDLRFERLLDAEHGTWPYDVEIIDVEFDSLNRLKGCVRKKVIVIERGRSHADLCRMLGIDEVK